MLVIYLPVIAKSTKLNFTSGIRTKAEKIINHTGTKSLNAPTDTPAVFELVDDCLPQTWDRNLTVHTDVATFICARCASATLDSDCSTDWPVLKHFVTILENPLKMRLN